MKNGDAKMYGNIISCVIAIIVGLCMAGLGMYLWYDVCDSIHYNDPDNYRDIVVEWKKESIIPAGFGSRTIYIVGAEDKTSYVVQLSSYMEMEEGKPYKLVKDIHYDFWKISYGNESSKYLFTQYIEKRSGAV